MEGRRVLVCGLEAHFDDVCFVRWLFWLGFVGLVGLTEGLAWALG